MSRRLRPVALSVVVSAIAAFPADSAPASAHVPRHAASKSHAGEFCTKKKQRYYRRHGFVCKRAIGGRLRLFEA